MKKVTFDLLEERDECCVLHEVYYQGKPFTGIACEHTSDHYSEYPYRNGKAHGKCTSVYHNGQEMNIFYAKHGTLIGEEFSWYASGIIKTHISHCSPRFEKHYSPDSVLVYENDIETNIQKRFYATGMIKSLEEDAKTTLFNTTSEIVIIKITNEHQTNYTYFNDLLLRDVASIINEVDLRGPIFKWVCHLATQQKVYFVTVISKLIAHENLFVKAEALQIAGRFGDHNCISAIEKELNNHRIPKYEWNIDKTGAKQYTRSISEMAKDALITIKNRL